MNFQLKMLFKNCPVLHQPVQMVFITRDRN